MVMRLCMSISLNVVRDAAVSCASLSRSEIRSLILESFTLCSLRVPATTVSTSAAAAGAGGGVAGEGVGAAGALGAAGAAGSAGAAAAGFSSAAAAGASPPGVILKSSAPTSTVSSSPAQNAVMVPDMGAATSTVTLSVSICTTTSSSAAYSPTSLRRVTTVPSVIESPISGT